MVTELDEPIQVEVFFADGKTKPLWFLWRGRKIAVKETTFMWKHTEGVSTFAHFAVTDGFDTYELVLNSKLFSWRLRKVEVEWRGSSST